ARSDGQQTPAARSGEPQGETGAHERAARARCGAATGREAGSNERACGYAVNAWRASSKSFKQWFDERLRDRHIPKWLRDRIWEAIFGKDFGLLKSLLAAAGFSGAKQ